MNGKRFFTLLILSLTFILLAAAWSGAQETATAVPTTAPAVETVAEPTDEPVAEPTAEPVAEPTEEPMAEPMEEPTEEPAAEESAEGLSCDEPVKVGFITDQTGSLAIYGAHMLRSFPLGMEYATGDPGTAGNGYTSYMLDDCEIQVYIKDDQSSPE
ncbi:MAG TPA: hypothetical protein PLK31_26215, partial [Chloroflexota bacterium]|nr:hypothetical protein [Chloroflexota bacterium]